MLIDCFCLLLLLLLLLRLLPSLHAAGLSACGAMRCEHSASCMLTLARKMAAIAESSDNDESNVLMANNGEVCRRMSRPLTTIFAGLTACNACRGGAGPKHCGIPGASNGADGRGSRAAGGLVWFSAKAAAGEGRFAAGVGACSDLGCPTSAAPQHMMLQPSAPWQLNSTHTCGLQAAWLPWQIVHMCPSLQRSHLGSQY
jgi:hypothetical protein